MYCRTPVKGHLMIIYNVGWLFFCISGGGGEQFSLFSIAHLLRVIYTEPMKRGFSYVKKMCFFGSQAFLFSMERE